VGVVTRASLSVPAASARKGSEPHLESAGKRRAAGAAVSIKRRGQMSQSAVTARAQQQLSCSCTFYRSARVHHDRLLTVEDDLDALIDLFDLAVTWGELDYSGYRLVEPVAWSEFMSGHRWQNVNRVQQIFQLATDVALRSQTVNASVGVR
jgi:hypothetical protein